MEKIIRQLVIVIGAVLFSLVAHAANDTKDTDANIYGHVINKKDIEAYTQCNNKCERHAYSYSNGCVRPLFLEKFARG